MNPFNYNKLLGIHYMSMWCKNYPHEKTYGQNYIWRIRTMSTNWPLNMICLPYYGKLNSVPEETYI